MKDTVLTSSFIDQQESALFDLGVTAYDNIHSPVFCAWLKFDRDRQLKELQNRYVFFSCAWCVGAHLADLIKQDFEKANVFLAGWMADVRSLSQSGISFSEEWFKAMDKMAVDFSDLHFISEARVLVALGLNTGVKKYPRIAQSLQVQAAYLDALAGKREKGAEIALNLIRKPYLLPSRRELLSICHRLMHVLAAANQLQEYRLVLWAGVSFPVMPGSLRDVFSRQIEKTYRGAWRATINPEVPFKYRLPFLLANLARLFSGVPLLRTVRLDVPIRILHIGVLHVFDHFLFKKSELFVQANRNASMPSRVAGVLSKLKSWTDPKLLARTRPIIVTRAMGGIGDILMMTPGLLALASKYPKAQIDFAVPVSFHPVLEMLPGIRVLDIDKDLINLTQYQRWINLTDCPAGRAESRQYPNVRINRIESFARAMGISKWRLRLGFGFVPFYQVSDGEREWACARMQELNPDGRPVVGLQPYAADSYKNWPYMQQLAQELSTTHCVLIFHHEPLMGFDGRNIHKIIEPLRRTVGLLSLCKRLVVVDSSFLHFSAPLGVSTIAVFGPTSGKVFSRYYRNVNYLAPRKPEYPCYPCWRNEHKPCHLTNGRESICLRSIKVEDVTYALSADWEVKKVSRFQRIVSWMRYGRE